MKLSERIRDFSSRTIGPNALEDWADKAYELEKKCEALETLAKFQQSRIQEIEEGRDKYIASLSCEVAQLRVDAERYRILSQHLAKICQIGEP